MKITFLGAVGTVTGSKFLVESGDTRILVDCGLYQGLKQLRLRNWKPLPFDPASLDAILLTHAHIDHSGYLPALVRDGYPGSIHCTEPTRSLCEIMLPDAGRIQEEDAEYANRKKFSKHAPALPLYTEADAVEVLDRMIGVRFAEEFQIGELRASFRPAGHILGAASACLAGHQVRVTFSGDLGRSDDLLMYPPEPPADADWIVMESTYGDRNHPAIDPIRTIAEVLRRTAARGGILLMPSFAVGRAQTLLYCLHEIFERDLAPRVPVFVNSPMATSVTSIYEGHVEYHRLDREACDAVCDVAHFVRDVEESKQLAERRDPMVIIAASGMATGGRVLHHLRALAPDPRNTILVPGFQAPGTRGADLVAGAPALKIHGRWVPVKAEIVQLGMLSAHADQVDLIDWLAGCRTTPRGVFLVHGDPTATDTLRRAIRDKLDYEPAVPEYLEAVELR